MTAADHGTVTTILAETDFNLIRTIVYQHTGIRLGDSKQVLVKNRLLKRLIALGLETFSQYAELIQTRVGLESELGELINCITTNETYFFRESKHFDILNERVFPEFAADPATKRSIWCAGCATGQEPYSIAIAALEYMAKHNSPFSLSVVATDVSEDALKTARGGAYPTHKSRGLTSEILMRYFEQNENGFAVKRNVRDLVRFKKLNLLTDKISDRFDHIFCRNVMIYFDTDSQERTLKNLHSHMKDGGLLFVGHAESLHRYSDILKAERLAGAAVYRKI